MIVLEFTMNDRGTKVDVLSGEAALFAQVARWTQEKELPLSWKNGDHTLLADEGTLI